MKTLAFTITEYYYLFIILIQIISVITIKVKNKSISIKYIITGGLLLALGSTIFQQLLVYTHIQENLPIPSISISYILFNTIMIIAISFYQFIIKKYILNKLYDMQEIKYYKRYYKLNLTLHIFLVIPFVSTILSFIMPMGTFFIKGLELGKTGLNYTDEVLNNIFLDMNFIDYKYFLIYYILVTLIIIIIPYLINKRKRNDTIVLTLIYIIVSVLPYIYHKNIYYALVTENGPIGYVAVLCFLIFNAFHLNLNNDIDSIIYKHKNFSEIKKVKYSFYYNTIAYILFIAPFSTYVLTIVSCAICF